MHIFSIQQIKQLIKNNNRIINLQITNFNITNPSQLPFKPNLKVKDRRKILLRLKNDYLNQRRFLFAII